MRIIFWEGCSRRFLWNISSCVTALSTEIITQDNWYGVLCTHCEAAPTQHGFWFERKLHAQCTGRTAKNSCVKCGHGIVSVSHFVHRRGVSTSVHAGIHRPPGRYPPWQVHPPGQAHPLAGTLSLGRYTPLRWSLQRTVRILLECFLVDTMRFKLTVKVKPRLLLKTDLGWIDLS